MKKPILIEVPKKQTIWDTDPSIEQTSIKPNQYAEVIHGTFSGSVCRVLKNMDGRCYVLEMPNGKQYIYHPHEVIPAAFPTNSMEFAQLELEFAGV
jgi:hypothetical protein